ncbi:alpha-latrocrustotoxin-Lt1a-like isoform X2 [Halichondria panicea]|uniref:alpha-latrocrustotoxin-Lt1a-like isoform X2 n=1 Tax=Halichondria panicea TaxID=6063 RepID=UPI00312BC4C8
MASRAALNGFTGWSNMRLVRGSCETADILQGIMSGCTMRVLLEELVGSAPKRLDSLEGLTANQKVTRVDWFIDALKTSGRIPKSTKVDSQMFALCSPAQVFPILWMFVCEDVTNTWRMAPLFQKQSKSQVLIADPLEVGPRQLLRTTSEKHLPFYVSDNGISITQPYKRTSKALLRPSTEWLLIDLVNGQLKMTVDGRKLHVEGIQDLVDTRVLCALVNSLVPGTFTAEVLLSDRWTINLALKTVSKIFAVQCLVDSADLNSADQHGVCAFLVYFIMSGYQFKQAQAVLNKLEELRKRKEDLQKLLAIDPSKQEKLTNSKLAKIAEEVQWIQSVYDVESCSEWVEHAGRVQAEVRATIAQKMKERFDVITVPRPLSISRLTELLVINLSLTRDCGFYCSEGKETLSVNRRIVLRDTQSGEFFEDFSGSDNTRGTVRDILKLQPFEVVEVNAGIYSNYEVYFESFSRNKLLKAGSKFLYQVFPGTLSQCQRLLLRVARVGETSTIRKLLLFFHKNKPFVNFPDPESGNTALHLASRHGHIDVALLLLESGATVHCQNSLGCTPFFLATEGLHRNLSNLLIEWGTDVHFKNKVSKTAMDLIRNADLEKSLRKKYTEHRELVVKVGAGDMEFVEKRISDHVTKKDPLASLRSRCVRGNTLLHIVSSLGSQTALEMLLTEHVDPSIVNESGATPLHRARAAALVKPLLTYGANVNARDLHGNTPLHMMCQDSNAAECVAHMVTSGALLDIENDKGLLAIQCAAAHGLSSIIQVLLDADANSVQQTILQEKHNDTTSSSLLYLSLVKDHMDCAVWLSGRDFSLKPGEADQLALRVLNGPPESCIDPVATFQFLLDHGANPNVEYIHDNTPLHLSARHVDLPELTTLLLSSGAHVTSVNTSFLTPLSVACKANNPAVATQLIDKGSNCQQMDVHGKCAFDYVNDHKEWMDSGHFSEEVKAILKAYSLKHAKDLVYSISKVVKVNRIKH